MNLQDLNELDFNNIGSWPAPIKGFIIILLCIGLGVGWYYMNTEEQLLNLETVEKKELALKTEFESKQAKAVNLEKYKKQLEEMKQSFGAMLRQLPNKTEVADLLVDVSQTGLASGLEFELFDPQEEVPREFYAELPIQIRVFGNYHELGEFISGLAALPRIVTIHDVTMEPRKDGELVMSATAKTYRYLEEEGAN
ncbi:type 4a pilus biogenesis protein PilO [Sedimenticola selenatireducens]|uniref:Pilus assembly protein PilO n=1 Tax=Sedimenticola selenatireducens TaxID=191960 RepID=A0A558DTI0_9GAMM|nr:type 4a pilus biogenesis protein PilO [Sedimenticola selenatireducens]TVO76770.1 pilus assembly protein PilO [Sedimenticola selenatireducens]TVT64213.1 MAG: pilus assembly protein PilO [Sedimenticola selenatireducens]